MKATALFQAGSRVVLVEYLYRRRGLIHRGSQRATPKQIKRARNGNGNGNGLANLSVPPFISEKDRQNGLIGKSEAIRFIQQRIQEVAPRDSTVLIEGDTGTGKELVARAIHSMSPRESKPFLAVNCAGLTESVLTSQLFGHKRGAFTGAVAD
jgi:transcriptional regulator with GAF, ATPase, and Fis domain